jgi:hypothetical protein
MVIAAIRVDLMFILNASFYSLSILEVLGNKTTPAQ